MTYDILEVNIKSRIVSIMGTGKSEDNADAYMRIAVMRRGCDEQFFVVVLTDTYKEGETWTGRKDEIDA